MKPRLAVRAILMHENRLLLVNAWPDPDQTLWCAPGGGVEVGQSLPDNLKREVMEETGLTISVGPPCLVNEFHDPGTHFHQVEVFFRCTLVSGALRPDWKDPEGIVHSRRFFAREDMAGVTFKPSSLPDVAWARGMGYDPLERILR